MPRARSRVVTISLPARSRPDAEIPLSLTAAHPQQSRRWQPVNSESKAGKPEAEALPVYRIFASVFTFTAHNAGLVCCGSATLEGCQEAAARMQALYQTLDDPRSILGLATDLDALTPAQVASAYRLSSKAAHPDRGGSAEQWEACKIAKRVLEDVRWRKAYSLRGWAGVYAAWGKAGLKQASGFDAQALGVEARPRFVGVAMACGRVVVAPVAALTPLRDDDACDLFESPNWLLLPPSSEGGYQASTYVDARLQPPSEEDPTDPGTSNRSDAADAPLLVRRILPTSHVALDDT